MTRSVEQEQPALVLADLHKRFRRGLFAKPTEALCGLSLSVARGEALGLIGPNGAGKSTALRIAMGLLHADRGSVALFGAPPSPASRRRVGYLPEELRLYPHLRPPELLDLLGGYLELGPEARAEARERALAELELGPLRERPIGELSRGQSRRVALAQALYGEPSLIVLDEPLSGLDPLARRQTRALLRRKVEAGAALLMSSHLLEDIERLCDRVAILREGRVSQEARIDRSTGVSEIETLLRGGEEEE